MEITFSPRAFYPAELKLLKKLVAQNEKMAIEKAKMTQNSQENVKKMLVNIVANPVEKKVIYNDDFTANR